MSTELLKDIGIGFVFLLSELLLFQHLPLAGLTPDPLLIYLFWLAGKYDRPALLLITGFLAFFQDAFFDLWGLNMFSKIVLIFVSYTFIRKRTEQQLLMWQVFLLILLGAIAHNVVFWSFGSFFDTYATQYAPLFMITGNALYTAFLGTLIRIFYDR